MLTQRVGGTAEEKSFIKQGYFAVSELFSAHSKGWIQKEWKIKRGLNQTPTQTPCQGHTCYHTQYSIRLAESHCGHEVHSGALMLALNVQRPSHGCDVYWTPRPLKCYEDHRPAAKQTAGQLALILSKVGLSLQLANSNLSG